jgi:hypothetical protein
MHFKRAGQTLFTARVTSQHTGILNGATEPLLECAGAAATIPFDINLWHRHLGHHSYADVQKMIKDGLVIGLHLDSKEQPVLDLDYVICHMVSRLTNLVMSWSQGLI